MSEKHKILIVDDDFNNRELLIDILGDDFDIYECADGKEAIPMLSNQGSMFSLVLLDINMAHVNGFQVLEAMNKLHLIEDVPVIMISSDVGPSIDRSFRLGATDYIPRPFSETIVKQKVINTIMLYSNQKRLINIVEEQVEEKEKNSGMLINILSHIVEFRNGESGLHVLHVRRITEILLDTLTKKTDKYALTKSQKAIISNASALHDIGKISIPDHILNKPGRFTDEEYAIMKTHSAAGGDLINQLPVYKDEPLVKTAFEICRWHHERYDGSGYPDGLKGDDIPISAQIVAMADVYDALTSERCYKKAFTHEKAIEMILNGECGCFNPILLECLVDAADLIKDELCKTEEEFSDSGARLITQEILQSKNISSTDILAQNLKYERTKNDFLTRTASGIVFEYVRQTHVLMFSERGSSILGVERTIIDPAEDEKLISIVGRESIETVDRSIKQTSFSKPDGECAVEFGGKRYNVMFRTLWVNDGEPYMNGAIGKLMMIE